MGRRVLLMVQNNNPAARELYTLVLTNDFPSWGVSFMTGIPENPLSILAAYDILIFEIGRASDPLRLETTRTYGRQLHEVGARTVVVTHFEDPIEPAAVAQAAADHVRCFHGELDWGPIRDLLRAIDTGTPQQERARTVFPTTAQPIPPVAADQAPTSPGGDKPAGLFGRLQGMLSRKETDSKRSP